MDDKITALPAPQATVPRPALRPARHRRWRHGRCDRGCAHHYGGPSWKAKAQAFSTFTGFAQKFGPVLSYIRLGKSPDALHQVRIQDQRADSLLGCDLVVSSSEQAMRTYDKSYTKAVVNAAQMPTGAFTRSPDMSLEAGARLGALRKAIGENLTSFDANKAADTLMGNSVYANVMLMGAAWQKGHIPVGLDALMHAIDLNGVTPAANKQAFNWGRLAAHDPEVRKHAQINPKQRRSRKLWTDSSRGAQIFLAAYQNKKWAGHYLGSLK